MINDGDDDDDVAKHGQRVASRRSGLRGPLPPLREEPKATSLGGRQHGPLCRLAGEKETHRSLAEQHVVRTLFLFPVSYKGEFGVTWCRREKASSRPLLYAPLSAQVSSSHHHCCRMTSRLQTSSCCRPAVRIFKEQRSSPVAF